jgi:hypothetical protein
LNRRLLRCEARNRAQHRSLGLLRKRALLRRGRRNSQPSWLKLPVSTDGCAGVSRRVPERVRVYFCVLAPWPHLPDLIDLNLTLRPPRSWFCIHRCRLGPVTTQRCSERDRRGSPHRRRSQGLRGPVSNRMPYPTGCDCAGYEPWRICDVTSFARCRRWSRRVVTSGPTPHNCRRPSGASCVSNSSNQNRFRWTENIVATRPRIRHRGSARHETVQQIASSAATSNVHPARHPLPGSFG